MSQGNGGEQTLAASREAQREIEEMDEVYDRYVKPVEITAVGQQINVGRGVTDHYRVILDHGERVSVEP